MAKTHSHLISHGPVFYRKGDYIEVINSAWAHWALLLCFAGSVGTIHNLRTVWEGNDRMMGLAAGQLVLAALTGFGNYLVIKIFGLRNPSRLSGILGLIVFGANILINAFAYEEYEKAGKCRGLFNKSEGDELTGREERICAVAPMASISGMIGGGIGVSVILIHFVAIMWILIPTAFKEVHRESAAQTQTLPQTEPRRENDYPLEGITVPRAPL